MAKPFQSVLNWIYRKFSDDPSKMLIWTGVAGWSVSSLAQAGAVLFNPKLSDEEKSFLLPQEAADAAVNVLSFFFITQSAKMLVSKLFSTGKFASGELRQYLKKNPELAKKVGKLDFDLGKELNDAVMLEKYNKAKDLGSVITTVGAGIVASNVITPIMRNRMASNVQKKYIDYKQNMQTSPYQKQYSSSAMKI